MTEELTAIDRRILEQVQKDSSLSTGELAEKVGLSQSPCWRRLQRLKDEGYITREVALLDRSKLDSSVVIFATVKMAVLTDEKRAEFMRKLENTPEIVECHTVFGEADLLLKIIGSSLPWYQDFILKVLMKMPGILNVQSTVTLAELKYTTAVPLRGKMAL